MTENMILSGRFLSKYFPHKCFLCFIFLTFCPQFLSLYAIYDFILLPFYAFSKNICPLYGIFIFFLDRFMPFSILGWVMCCAMTRSMDKLRDRWDVKLAWDSLRYLEIKIDRCPPIEMEMCLKCSSSIILLDHLLHHQSSASSTSSHHFITKTLKLPCNAPINSFICLYLWLYLRYLCVIWIE